MESDATVKCVYPNHQLKKRSLAVVHAQAALPDADSPLNMLHSLQGKFKPNKLIKLEVTPESTLLTALLQQQRQECPHSRQLAQLRKQPKKPTPKEPEKISTPSPLPETEKPGLHHIPTWALSTQKTFEFSTPCVPPTQQLQALAPEEEEKVKVQPCSKKGHDNFLLQLECMIALVGCDIDRRMRNTKPKEEASEEQASMRKNEDDSPAAVSPNPLHSGDSTRVPSEDLDT